MNAHLSTQTGALSSQNLEPLGDYSAASLCLTNLASAECTISAVSKLCCAPFVG